MSADDQQRIVSGDAASLTRVIVEFGPLVRDVALRVTGNEADADDVAQEVFIGLPEALRSFSGGNFPGWLKVVTRHHALMLMRSETRRRRLATQPDGLVDAGPGDRVLTRLMIEEALVDVDARQREVLLLKYDGGWSHREIARSLGITENHSQVLLHRAREALKELLS